METLKAHGGSEYFKALGEAIKEEGLVSKPLNIMMLEPFSGFESR
jgi:hypothetical protein